MPARIAPHVRHVCIDGRRIILDLRNGAYLAIDEIGSAFWAAVTGERSVDEALAELAGRFDASEAILRHDLERFAARCLADGLLVRGAAAGETPRSAGAPGAGRSALFCLVATAWRLKRRGLYEVYRTPRPWGERRSVLSLDEALARFRLAENVFISARAPKDCLPRSLALFRYLAGRGFAAEHVIGVRRAPFAAHAWVEVEGRAVLEATAPAFSPLARMSAAQAAHDR